MKSTRDEIIKLLCDPELFPASNPFHRDEIDKIILDRLPKEAHENVQDVINSISQALETIGGYSYNNGESHVAKTRDVEKELDPDKKNTSYIYTFLE
jgi:hypothetical protein